MNSNPDAAVPRISVAPMMERTDRHFRVFMRGITRRTLLYTPMLTTGALLHGPRARLLAHAAAEHPLSLQLGGSDPEALARCAELAQAEGYDEVNLNVGCPSSRVQGGRFGACLMLEPERVARCVSAMRAAVDIPVTVKHRIGVDDRDRYEDMLAFVDTVAARGCTRFTVHARKAWLSGLSPKQNREVPPLRHREVYRLKRERSALFIETNGGVDSLDEIAAHLDQVDAVMIGRAAWSDPMLFAAVDRAFLGGDAAPPSRREVALAFVPHAAAELDAGAHPVGVLRNLLNVFHGRPGTRAWKQGLQDCMRAPPRGPGALRERILRLLDRVEAVRHELVRARARA